MMGAVRGREEAAMLWFDLLLMMRVFATLPPAEEGPVATRRQAPAPSFLPPPRAARQAGAAVAEEHARMR